MQNCLDLYERVTSTTPGMCLGGTTTFMAWEVINSAQTTIVPNTTWIPSKKLSPIIMTVDPPLVHPSFGLMALIHGVAVNGTSYKISRKRKKM